MRDKSFDDSIAEIYAEDPEFAVEMIDNLLDDGEAGETFAFLIQVSRAFGLSQKISGHMGLKEHDLRWPLHAGAALPSLEELRGLLQTVKLHLAERRVSAA